MINIDRFDYFYYKSRIIFFSIISLETLNLDLLIFILKSIEKGL